MPETTLEPIAPDEAVRLYLRDRQNELADATIDSYRYKLEKVVEWCEADDLENLNSLSGRDLLRFKQYRAQDLNSVSLKGQLDALRAFVKWCESIDAVESGMKMKVKLPDPDNERLTDFLDADRAEEILEHLDRFEYASIRHVAFAIMWRTAARVGSVRALDLEDFDADEPCLMFRHRPETDTPLKNKKRGERDVHVDSYYAQVIQDYIDNNRYDKEDENGRKPLLATRQGRPVVSSLRRYSYGVTIPCFAGSCPHDKEPDTCEWTQEGQRSKCPSSRSCHALRRGAITDHRNRGIPAELVSDRVDATPEVIEEHYDKRTERERMRVRRRLMEER